MDKNSDNKNDEIPFLSKVFIFIIIVSLAIIVFNMFFKSNNGVLNKTLTPHERAALLGPKVLQQVEVTMQSITTQLNKVTDTQTAKNILPSLKSSNESLAHLANVTSKLPTSEREPIRTVVASFVPKIQENVNRMRKIPGVGSIIRSELETTVANIKKFE